MNRIFTLMIGILLLGVSCTLQDTQTRKFDAHAQEGAAEQKVDFDKLRKSYVRYTTTLLAKVCVTINESTACSEGAIAGGVASGFVAWSDDTGSKVITAAHSCVEPTDFAERQLFLDHVKSPTGDTRVEFRIENTLWTYDGRSYRNISVGSKNVEKDVCLLNAPGMIGYAPASFSDTEPDYGDEIYLVGASGDTWYVDTVPISTGRYGGKLTKFPKDYDFGKWSLREGLATSKFRQVYLIARPGASGSAVYDSRGRVIGVLSMVDTDNTNVAYVASLDSIKGLVTPPAAGPDS